MASQDQEFVFLAHDLSQLLWAIQGRARALALQLASSDAAEVSLIAEDAAAAAAMLADEAQAAADPQAAVRLAWRQTCDRAGAQGVSICGCRLRGPQATPLVAMPASALRRILGNLFANAVAARPGDVTVDCKAEIVADSLHIEVCDDGPGIAASLRPRLFSPGTTSGGPGHGLGLAGARALARRWGGELEHLETPTGACFRLAVPLVGQTVATIFPPSPPGPTEAAETTGITDETVADQAALRVLVVDDDPSVRGMLQHLLTAMGHEPVLAADCDAASALSAAAACDVALVDLCLPGRSGCDAAAQLRARDPALAIVLLTGWGRERELAAAPPSCVDLTGVKPLDLPQLRQLLARAARLTARRRDGRDPEDR